MVLVVDLSSLSVRVVLVLRRDMTDAVLLRPFVPSLSLSLSLRASKAVRDPLRLLLPLAVVATDLSPSSFLLVLFRLRRENTDCVPSLSFLLGLSERAINALRDPVLVTILTILFLSVTPIAIASKVLASSNSNKFLE